MRFAVDTGGTFTDLIVETEEALHAGQSLGYTIEPIFDAGFSQSAEAANKNEYQSDVGNGSQADIGLLVVTFLLDESWPYQRKSQLSDRVFPPCPGENGAGPPRKENINA
jgi:hypothetical protein